jgi:hypothetical protein
MNITPVIHTEPRGTGQLYVTLYPHPQTGEIVAVLCKPRRSGYEPYTLKHNEQYDERNDLVINRWGLPKKRFPLGDVLDQQGDVLRNLPRPTTV